MDEIQNPDNDQILARMWSDRNSPSLLMVMQNGTATSEDSLVISYKTKHTRSSDHTL